MGESYDDLEWDGTLADDTPLVTIQLSAKWRDYLLGAVSVLKQEQLWASDTNWLALEQQLNEIERRLMGLEGAEMFETWGPYHYDWCVMQGTGDYGLSRQVHASQIGNGYAWQNPAQSSGNFCAVPGYFPTGTYYMLGNAIKGVNYGKARFRLVGEVTVEILTADFYHTSTLFNHPVLASFQVNQPGKYNFVIENYGKNGLSSDYHLAIERMTIRRTG